MKAKKVSDAQRRAAQLNELTACGETLAVVRKKVLLRILARESAERSRLSITDADLERTSEQLRSEFNLLENDEHSRWLTDQGLTPAAYSRAMRDFTIVRLLEETYAERIDELVAEHVAISAVRLRAKPGAS
jgi:hypothetical protein